MYMLCTTGYTFWIQIPVSVKAVGGFSLGGIILKAFDVYLTSVSLSVVRKELSTEYS